MRLSAYVWVSIMSFALAIPNKPTSPPDGYTYKNNKITLVKVIVELLAGDKVCQDYYREYFQGWAVDRRYMASKYKKNRIPEYDLPYVHYPTKEAPIIEVPVEAIKGETYGPHEGRTPPNVPGCVIMCQDIRKTMEWVLGAKQGRSMHLRVKISFTFPCLEGMLARTTERESWREVETEEEFEAAIKLLESLGPRSDLTKLADYNFVVKGEKGVVTSCECYYPTEEELTQIEIDKVIATRENIKKRKMETERMASKRRTASRPSWQRARQAAAASASAAVSNAASSSSGSRDFHDLDQHVPPNANAGDDDVFDVVGIEEIDVLPAQGQITCHDYHYPVIGMDRTHTSEDVLLSSDFDSYTAFLQAILTESLPPTFGFASGPGSSSGKPGPDKPSRM